MEREGWVVKWSSYSTIEVLNVIYYYYYFKFGRIIQSASVYIFYIVNVGTEAQQINHLTTGESDCIKSSGDHHSQAILSGFVTSHVDDKPKVQKFHCVTSHTESKQSSSQLRATKERLNGSGHTVSSLLL